MKIQNLILESVNSATNMSYRQLPFVTVNKIVYVTQRDKFVTEMIVNVDCQHRGIFVIIFFLTFQLSTMLTNESLKDENTKFSP